MNSRKFVFLVVFSVSFSFSLSQTMYKPIPTVEKTINKKQVYDYDKYRFTCFISPTTGKWTFCFGDTNNRVFFSFEDPQNSEYMQAKVFASEKKTNPVIVLVSIGQSFNMGSHVFFCYPNQTGQQVGFLNLSAYNKNADGYMDYNSILPYTTIVGLPNKWLFSFETPLMVFKPGTVEERILKENELFYQFSSNGWEAKWNTNF